MGIPLTLDHPSADLAACPECDLLLVLSALPSGQRAVCPRCGAVVRDVKADPVGRPLALTAAALLLFVPANFLPILELDILGQSSAATMVGAVEILYTGGLFLVALMVFFCSILAPVVTMGILFVILAAKAALDRTAVWGQIKTESLESVLAGGVAFATPDNENMGEQVKNGTSFPLFDAPEEEWLTWKPQIPSISTKEK